MGPSWPLLSPSSQFWLALGPLLAALGSLLVALGSLLAPLGLLLAHSRAALGRSWLALGSLWGALGLLLRVFWSLLGRSWPLETTPRSLRKRCECKNTNLQKVVENVRKTTHFRSQDGSEMPQDGPKIAPRGLLAALGRSGTALGPLLAALGRSWLALGASWGDLERA